MLQMNNGDLPMRIHKRLTFKVHLRMCTGIIIQKSSMQDEVIRQVCLQLFGGFCAVNRKKNHIFSSAFYEDGCVSVSMTTDESSFAINHYFHAFNNIYNYKKASQNYPFWGHLTQNRYNL